MVLANEKLDPTMSSAAMTAYKPTVSDCQWIQCLALGGIAVDHNCAGAETNRRESASSS